MPDAADVEYFRRVVAFGSGVARLEGCEPAREPHGDRQVDGGEEQWPRSEDGEHAADRPGEDPASGGVAGAPGVGGEESDAEDGCERRRR